MADLTELGWSRFFAAEAEAPELDGLVPARVVAEHRSLYRVLGEGGELPARLAGRMRHHAASPADLPAVGDWVMLDAEPDADAAVIRALLPRRSKFSRKVAGERAAEQVVAANVDVVWIVSALDADLSLRRIERYLALGWESGATPVVVLSKADLRDDVDDAVRRVESVALGTAVHAVSGLTGQGTDALRAYLGGHATVALLGSSGVGKSTLINHLAGGEVQRVAEVRASDQKGRHTTTHRQLVRLPGGGLIVDTPGMRELQLWDAEGGVQDTFGDVEELAAGCRFADCRHAAEPGCAVLAAVESGALDAGRLASYHKLQRELAFLERRQDARAQSEADHRLRSLHKAMRHPKKL